MWEYVVKNIEQTLCSIGGIRLKIRLVHISTFQPNSVSKSNKIQLKNSAMELFSFKFEELLFGWCFA